MTTMCTFSMAVHVMAAYIFGKRKLLLTLVIALRWYGIRGHPRDQECVC